MNIFLAFSDMTPVTRHAFASLLFSSNRSTPNRSYGCEHSYGIVRCFRMALDHSGVPLSASHPVDSMAPVRWFGRSPVAIRLRHALRLRIGNPASPTASIHTLTCLDIRSQPWIDRPIRFG